MDNRLLLMQCAKELFYAKGYDAVGVQEIVDRAGITKPTLYYYFGSKIGLLKALLDARCSDLRSMIQEVLREEHDIRGNLYRLAQVYCSFFEQDKEFYMLMNSLFYSAPENEAYQAVKPYMSEYYQAIVRIFDRASGQLGNMNGRQHQFAVGFIGAINAFLLVNYELDPEKRIQITEEQVTAMVNQFMYGIFS